MNQIKNQNQLRIAQYDTVQYDLNLNPLGIPESVKKAIQFNVSSIIKYPDTYYNKLKETLAEYVGVPEEYLVLGNGANDMLKLYAALVAPKKAMLLSPGANDYAKVLESYNTKIKYYDLKEKDDYVLDMADFISKLDSRLDMVIIGNPNNPTSKKISREDMETLAEACKQLDIFLLIDEMYIEFLDDYKDYTSVGLCSEYENLAVIRSVSKFFSVPGLRFAYAVMNNETFKSIVNLTSTKNNIASLTAIAVTEALKDEKYIEDSQSTIHTERSLVYLAMSTCRSLQLVKPDANYMLVKILDEDISAETVAEHCRQVGVVIRKCGDFRGLDNKYFRICFMNPKQNDLAVNTILEVFKKDA